MDVALTLTGLNEDLARLVEDGDFEGAEEFLFSVMGRRPEWMGFVHYQFGRLYRRWNKLSSAVQHLNLAVDVAAGNELFLLQVLDELNAVKRLQKEQRP